MSSYRQWLAAQAHAIRGAVRHPLNSRDHYLADHLSIYLGDGNGFRSVDQDLAAHVWAIHERDRP